MLGRETAWAKKRPVLRRVFSFKLEKRGGLATGADVAMLLRGVRCRAVAHTSIVGNARQNRSGDCIGCNPHDMIHATALVRSTTRQLVAKASRRNASRRHSSPESGSYCSAGDHSGDDGYLASAEGATREYRSSLGSRRRCRGRRWFGCARARSTSLEFGGLAGFGDHQRASVAGNNNVVIHA